MQIDPTTVLSMVEAGLDTLYSEGIVRLFRLFDENMLDLIGLDYLHSGDASNWLVIPIYQFYLQPGRVETCLKKALKDSQGQIGEWEGDDDFYSLVSGGLTRVFHATADIEEVVDDIFMLTGKPGPTRPED
jgi:hypothetical protein